MSTYLWYNGVMLNKVRVTEYKVLQEANESSVAVGRLKMQCSGEALFTGYTYGGASTSNLVDLIDSVRRKLNTPRQQLLIVVDPTVDIGPSQVEYAVPLARPTPSATAFVLASVAAQGVATVANEYVDECGGPFVETQMVNIAGTNACVVNFTFMWSQPIGEDMPNNIRSFLMQTRFSIDETGATTIRKSGSLVVKYQPLNHNPHVSVRATDTAAMTAIDPLDVRNDVIVNFTTQANVSTAGPDFFRRLVSGNLERGFRRVAQDFAIDASHTRMLFEIVDQETFHGMPSPARVGDCSYTFERSLDEQGILGIKRFVASVKGDRDVTPGALLNLCVRLSQNRVDYVNDLITSIRVTENNMLTENSISFEVTAKAVSTMLFDAAEHTSSIVPGVGSAITARMLTPILMPVANGTGPSTSWFTFVPAKMPDEYGSAGIIRMVPSAYNPTQTSASAEHTMPSTLLVNRLNDGQNPCVYQFPDAVFDVYSRQAGQPDPWVSPRFIEVPNGQLDLPPKATTADTAAAGTAGNKHHDSRGGSTRSVTTGMISIPAVGDGKAKVFQLHAPVVYISDQSESARPNEAPLRSLSDLTSTAVVTGTTFATTAGRADVHGNRMLAANFTTDSIQRYDGSAALAPNDFSIQTRTIDGVSVQLIEYFPLTLPLPPEPNQGTLVGFTYPTYLAGVTGTNQGYIGGAV